MDTTLLFPRRGIATPTPLDLICRPVLICCSFVVLGMSLVESILLANFRARFLAVWVFLSDMIWIPSAREKPNITERTRYFLKKLLTFNLISFCSPLFLSFLFFSIFYPREPSLWFHPHYTTVSYNTQSWRSWKERWVLPFYLMLDHRKKKRTKNTPENFSIQNNVGSKGCGGSGGGHYI